MSQNYVLVSRKNPLRPQDTPKYYAYARSGMKSDIFSICKRISQRSSYSRGELEGCVGEFLVELENVLEEGNIVQLGRLGNFRLTIKNYGGSATIKDFNDSYIKGCRVNFHPSVHLTELCKNIKFTHYNPDKKKQEAEETNP